MMTEDWDNRAAGVIARFVSAGSTPHAGVWAAIADDAIGLLNENIEVKNHYEKLVSLGWRPIVCDVCGEGAAAEYPVDALLRGENRQLRRMFCSLYAGGKAYMDDGEAQFADVDYPIDFINDTIEEIHRKMLGIAMRILKAQMEGL